MERLVSIGIAVLARYGWTPDLSSRGLIYSLSIINLINECDLPSDIDPGVLDQALNRALISIDGRVARHLHVCIDASDVQQN